MKDFIITQIDTMVSHYEVSAELDIKLLLQGYAYINIFCLDKNSKFMRTNPNEEEAEEKWFQGEGHIPERDKIVDRQIEVEPA